MLSDLTPGNRATRKSVKSGVQGVVGHKEVVYTGEQTIGFLKEAKAGTRASFVAESALASMSEPSQERTPFAFVRGRSR